MCLRLYNSKVTQVLFYTFLYAFLRFRKNVCQFSLAETVYSSETTTVTEQYAREVCCKRFFGGCLKKCKRTG